jgi:DNA-binding protein YbaB
MGTTCVVLTHDCLGYARHKSRHYSHYDTSVNLSIVDNSSCSSTKYSTMNLTVQSSFSSWRVCYRAGVIVLLQIVWCCCSTLRCYDGCCRVSCLPTTYAWIQPQGMSQKRQGTETTTSLSPQRRRQQHHLNAFFWFGGGDDNNNNNSDHQDDANNKNSNERTSLYSLWPTNSYSAATTTTTTTTNNENSNFLQSVSQIMDTKLGSFKSSQKVADKMSSILTELANTMVEGYSSSSDNSNKKYKNKVKVTFNGQQVPVRVQIDEQYFQDLISSSLSQSQSQSATTSTSKDSSSATTSSSSNAAVLVVEELNLAITTAMKEAHAKSSQKLQDKLKGILYQDLGFF